MESYQGNRYPFCYALFAKADEAEALSVLEALERRDVRCALPGRKSGRALARAGAVLLFLSPDAVRDERILQGVAEAGAQGKTVLAVHLKETELTPGLSMQLGTTQAVLKYREASDAAFYEKLMAAPVLRSLSVTPAQQKALRRHALLWALAGALVLLAAALVGLNWKPIRARLPDSTLRRLGVPMNFDSVEALYVYGETPLEAYVTPRYRLYADGERDWAYAGERLIPPGNIQSLEDFALLTNLRELCLCNDPIESLDPIMSLKQLTLLDVSHDGLSDLRGLGALDQLTTLNLAHNSLSGLEGIEGLKALKTLNLAYTDLVSLETLKSLPSLETVYIDASLLDAAAALGEVSFALVCVDTPVYDYAELAAALSDPSVTDVRIMNGLTIPQSAELTVRPEVALMGAGLAGNFSVINYGTVHVCGVWEMGLCSRINYGTVVVEDGGLYTGGMCDTITTGAFRIAPGGRQNLERGATFSLSGGVYENDGDVYFSDGYQLKLLGGRVVNRGALHLTSADYATLTIGIDRDRFENDGAVYLDGVPISADKLFEED
jgi:hypothetical protein